MAVFTYISKDRGSLVSGHSAEIEYSIEIPLSVWSPDSKKEESVRKSLSNKKFTILHYIERFFRLSTVSTDDQAIIDGLIEMFDSVANGEDFTIDPYGTLVAPGATTYTVTIDGNHKQKRENQTEFSFSAKVEVL